MQIIRDEETFGLMMIPLFVDWHVRRCNVKDCKNKPSTIITGLGEFADGKQVPPVGMCEMHFQHANQGKPIVYTYVWDNFDAFVAEPVKPECFKCIHKHDIPGDAHVSCQHPYLSVMSYFAMQALLTRSPDRHMFPLLNIRGNYTGISKGWFNWPFNFDPVWLEQCEGYEEKKDAPNESV